MFVIGITGGIGSGKSALTKFLMPAAAAVIDADEIARDILGPGTPLNKAVIDRFGPAILGENGSIDRLKLGKLVFADKANVVFLNRLMHPEIIRVIRSRLESFSAGPDSEQTIILRAPLLIEAGLTDLADLVVVVTADEDTRIDRLVKNRGMTREEALLVMAAQATDKERAASADIIVSNNGTLDDLAGQARLVIEEAARRRGGPRD